VPVTRGLVAVVLAAGSGERLAPLTRLLPKALCPVGNEPLVDLALGRAARVLDAAGASAGGESMAVNVHHGRDALVDHLAGRVVVSVEDEVALGTAGGVGNLRGWIAGRDVLVANADAWLGGAVDAFADGWDRERVRLLCVPASGGRGDFGTACYAGMCLLPWAQVERLGSEPSGLYEVLWRGEWEAGRLDLVVVDTPFLDCGTPADYLRANLYEAARSDAGSLVAPGAVVATGSSVTRSVIGAGAEVRGEVADAVVWPGSVVHTGERLLGGIRAGQLTVLVR
jgi:hypothetical protein